ncbi:MAG TPA: M15 family metallopeptidase [Rubrobacter sp.]|nr:M15 family metallopeptidase [Rubrobacter sp.]
MEASSWRFACLRALRLPLRLPLPCHSIRPCLCPGRRLRGSLSYTFSREVSEAAKKNRRVLLEAMVGAGFFNYGYEWWHYSYGERYWAHAGGERAARYGSLWRSRRGP